MYRNMVCSWLVCVLLFFLYPFIAAADTPDDVRTKRTLVENSKDDMDTAEENYSTIKSAMETLNGEFDSNQKKVAQGLDVTVTITGGAIISAAAAVVSGGSLAPAAFAASIALKTAAQTAATSWKSKDLVDAMGTVHGYLSSALSDVQSKYNTYSSRYSAYIRALASHSLVRFTSNNVKTSVYTASQLDYAVNTSGVDSGYYHLSAQSPSGSDHAVRKKLTYKHWETQPLGYGDIDWNTVALEEKYECKGTCKVKFGSAYDAWNSHRQKCGLPETQPVSVLADYTTRMAILGALESEQGCGEGWYTCDSNAATEAEAHKERTCAKTYTNANSVSSPCEVPYRNCMGQTRDHNESDIWSFESAHSDTADNSTENPVVSPTPTPTPPSDGTPNCPDCTSHCSSPCSCSTSGTCNGTVVDNTPNCSGCTSDCSSPCSCSTSGTCGGTVVDNTPNCSSCTNSCSACPPVCSACNTPYNSNSTAAVNRHRVRTCRFSECRQTWQRCQGPTPICNKPYRKRNGLRCWE